MPATCHPHGSHMAALARHTIHTYCTGRSRPSRRLRATSHRECTPLTHALQLARDPPHQIEFCTHAFMCVYARGTRSRLRSSRPNLRLWPSYFSPALARLNAQLHHLKCTQRSLRSFPRFLFSRAQYHGIGHIESLPLRAASLYPLPCLHKF